MSFGIVLLGVVAASAIARVVFLNSEIKTLAAASSKFLTISQTAPSADGKVSVEVEEAKTEYEWLKNATDLKKEARLIWIAGAGILLVVFVLAWIL